MHGWMGSRVGICRREEGRVLFSVRRSINPRCTLPMVTLAGCNERVAEIEFLIFHKPSFEFRL